MDMITIIYSCMEMSSLNIQPSIFFCALQKRETHAGLERHKIEWTMIELLICVKHCCAVDMREGLLVLRLALTLLLATELDANGSIGSAGETLTDTSAPRSQIWLHNITEKAHAEHYDTKSQTQPYIFDFTVIIKVCAASKCCTKTTEVNRKSPLWISHEFHTPQGPITLTHTQSEACVCVLSLTVTHQLLDDMKHNRCHREPNKSVE